MNINQVWPEWHEDCVLGEGSFGKVYRARRVEYGLTNYSAIKVLTVPKNQQEIKHARSQGMNDQDIYNYFRSLVDNLLNEIMLMDNLKGAKNVVNIEDYKIIEREGEIGWDIFIRMELLTPFDSFVSKPEFSQKDVIQLGIDICSALEVCEQNYIVHRDIKPDNIFVSKFGEYKLGDFGIAKKLEASTANLSRKGTLNYMAPEVYKSEEYGSNVDIYSLGLVLYTLLNNNRTAFLPSYPSPISYKDNEEALAKRLSGVPLTPPCNASASLSATILKACAYSPRERFQTATEFKNALIAEWNVLVQSGGNSEINSSVMYHTLNIDQMLQNTTGDMNSNGRIIAGGNVEGTTVLDQSENYAPPYNNYNANSNCNYSVPANYSSSKSNKACRILSWPIAIALIILSFVQMFDSTEAWYNQTAVLAAMSIGFIVVISDRNKVSIGIAALVLSLYDIFFGLGNLVGGIEESISVPAVISLVSGLVLLFGAIVIMAQTEVRFGGTLCLCSFGIEWLYIIYRLFNGGYKIDLFVILVAIAKILLLLWSYGYKSDREKYGIQVILYILTYLIATCIAIEGIVYAIKCISFIF